MHFRPSYGIAAVLNQRRHLEMEKEEEEKYQKYKEMKEKEEEKEKKIKKVKEKYTDFFDDDTDSHSKIGDFFYNHIEEIAALSASLVIIAGASGTLVGLIQSGRDSEYRNHLDDYKVVYNDTDYSIHDVYVVYNTDNVWFCTRKLAEITENEKEVGSHGGYSNEYYYRDLIYDYYDLKTGEKICQDHEENFYIESIDSLYTYDDVKEHNGNISYEELVNEQTLDNLLSREPEARIKR